MPANETGFWVGVDAPASVDWCEPNYVQTALIAEFWNTLSSMPLVLLGAFGAWQALRRTPRLEPRFVVCFVALAIVGLGSMAFHATLLHSAQAADELPMIYGGLALLYCLLNRRGHDPGRERRWALVLTAYGVAFTVAYFAFDEYFTLFIWSYAGIVTLLVVGSTIPQRCIGGG